MTRWLGLAVAVCYGLVSISITFFNKAVFDVWQFHGSSTLTLGQILFSLVFLQTFKRIGLLHYADFSVATATKLLPLMFAFSGMVLTGLGALRFVNVPMYRSQRRVARITVVVH